MDPLIVTIIDDLKYRKQQQIHVDANSFSKLGGCKWQDNRVRMVVRPEEESIIKLV